LKRFDPSYGVIHSPKDETIPNAHRIRQKVECGMRRADLLEPPMASWIKPHGSHYSNGDRLIVV
jgi:hypothetical protein